MDQQIMEAERRICESLDLDLSAIWQWSAGSPGFFTLTHFYSAEEGPQPDGRANHEDFPWFIQQMLAGRIMAISSLEELPAEAARDREGCRQFGIRSNLTIPLSVGGEQPIGVFGLNTTRAERGWPDELVKRLQLVGLIFANALARKRADQALQESEAHLEACADLAGLGCYEVDFLAPSTFTDDRFAKICGFGPGKHQGLRWLQFWMDHLHPDDRQRVLDERQKLHDGRLECLSSQYRYLHPTEGVRWLDQGAVLD